MSIAVALTHHTEYRYERPVGLGTQTICLRPAPLYGSGRKRFNRLAVWLPEAGVTFLQQFGCERIAVTT